MLSHRQGCSCGLLLSVCSLVFILENRCVAQSVSYHVSASEVRVVFFATDAADRSIETVSRDDFAVVDSGNVIRDFRSLVRTEETALHIIVLVDTSESMGPYFHETVRDVERITSQEDGAGSGNLSVASFSGLKPLLLCAGNCRGPQLEAKLLSIEPAGPTPLFDTLAYAAGVLSSQQTTAVRDVIILFSDGDDTISTASGHEALSDVLASGALLYAVNTSPLSDTRGAITLQQLAEATGGRSFSARDNTVNILQAILADLRTSYVVTYALPERSRGFHSLRILPKHNLNLRFHCRKGYYYENVR